MDVDNEMPLEVITMGNYYFKNGKHYILFDEMAGQRHPDQKHH